MDTKISLALYRGHTHAELAMMPNSPMARIVGNWARDVLAEHEWVKEGRHWDKIAQKLIYIPRGYWKLSKMYCRYDGATNRMHIPIAYADDLIKVLKDWNVEVRDLPLPDYPLRKIKIKMQPGWKDQAHQVELIKKCSEPTFGMKGLAMQTGKGKTYSATKAAVNLGYATMVIAPNSLPQQWLNSIREQTDATSEEVYKIEGFETLAALAKHPEYKPSIFVANIKTMQIFQKGEDNYDLLPWDYRTFFKEYGIGTKIVDECHLNFHATSIMDLETNVPYNLYCSATFDQTKRDAKAIFDRVYPPAIRYGIESYDKYVKVVWLNHAQGEVMERKCIRGGMYMHVLYEKELLKSKQKLEHHVKNIIEPALNQFFINKRQDGNKCLIFCSGVEFATSVAEVLGFDYPTCKVRAFTANSKLDVIKNADIIVSTLGKSSTGLDVKGLILAINTVSIRTPVLTNQMLGRLRKINGTELVYVDMCDVNINAHIRHASVRKETMRSLALKFYEINGWHDSRPFQ